MPSNALRRSLIPLLLLATALVAPACGGSMQYAEAIHPMTPEPNDAVVVFLRPGRYGGKAETYVVADDGVWLGTLQGRQRLVVTMAPGAHRFVTFAENTDVIHAELAPGKVYYVLIHIRPGVWKARHTTSRLSPDQKRWAKVQAWVDGTREVVPKPGARGPNPRVVQKHLLRSERIWERLDERKRDLRTLYPDSGL